MRLRPLLALSALLLSACGEAEAAVPQEHCVPFPLTELFTSGAGIEACFEVLDGAGRALPFALVEFTWSEGGRTAFQTDARGSLWMRFARPREVAPATVWVRTVPDGQSLVEHEYRDYARPLEAGSLRVRVSPYANGS